MIVTTVASYLHFMVENQFLGTVPGPIIFGAIFDSTCILWQENKGSEQGSCWIYDNGSLAFKLFFTFLGLKVGYSDNKAAAGNNN